MTTAFLRDISCNPANASILARWDELALPNAWLVAGCLFQTIGNLQAERAPEFGIKRFLVLETCVGARPNQCHAPFDLAGIYAGTPSPNPLTPYPELFAARVASYRERWPDLRERIAVSDGI